MMEPLFIELDKSFDDLKKSVCNVKKRMELICCLKHDERVEQAYDAFQRVDRLMEKLARIADELTKEERETLAAEYQYYFGDEHKNPYEDS